MHVLTQLKTSSVVGTYIHIFTHIHFQLGDRVYNAIYIIVGEGVEYFVMTKRFCFDTFAL